MNNSINRKYFCLLALLSFGFFIQTALANDSFQNNLLKTDIHKSPVGGVKIILYTSKPYKDSVVTNKKSDDEYVILMPETANSLTSKPVFSSASDIIKKVEVKTQQYNGNVKGYTKITISTSKPIEIIPQVQTLNPSKYILSEKDYKELLVQASKNQTKTVAQKETKKTAQKTVKSVPIQTKKEKPVLVSKIIKKIAPVKEETVIKKSHRKSNYKEKQRETISKTKEETYKVIKSKKINKPIVKKVLSTKEAPTVGTQQVQTKKAVSPKTVNSTEPVVTQPISTPQSVSPVKPAEPISNATVPMPISKYSKIKNVLVAYVPGLTEARLNNLFGIIKNNLYSVLAVISIAFILLLLVARKMTTSMRNQKKDFVKNLEEKPFIASDINEKINEDMSWKEKFQTYVETTSSEAKDEDIEIRSSSQNKDLDDLFSVENQQVNIDTSATQDNFSTTIQHEASEKDESIPLETEIQQKSILEEENNIPTNIEQSIEEDSKYKESTVAEEAEGFSLNDGIDTAWESSDVFATEEDEDVSLEELFGEEDLEQELQQSEFSSDFEVEENLIEEEPVEEDISNIYEQQLMENQITPGLEYYQEKEKSENEIVKSEYIIDDGKGLYLVDYENSTALVGQINDDIFILKRFDRKIDDKLQARLNERKSNSTSYMTKVGDFKAIVEVTPNNMNLLIEL